MFLASLSYHTFSLLITFYRWYIIFIYRKKNNKESSLQCVQFFFVLQNVITKVPNKTGLTIGYSSSAYWATKAENKHQPIHLSQMKAKSSELLLNNVRQLEILDDKNLAYTVQSLVQNEFYFWSRGYPTKVIPKIPCAL